MNMQHNIYALFLVLIVAVAPIWTTCPAQCQCKKGSVNCHRQNLTSEDLKVLAAKLPLDTYELTLSENLLEYFPVENFTHLTKLSGLTLSQNLISEYPKNLSVYMPSLVSILINQNKLVTLEADDLIGYENIETLDLYGNKITKLPAGCFKRAPKLKELFLEKNQISSISKDAFTALTELETLSLENNALKDVEVGTFDNQKNMRKIWLSGNDLTRIHPNLFTSFSSMLFKMHLNNNSLTTLEPGTFKNLKIVALDLSYNGISLIKKSVFEKTDVFRTLNLENNPISCDCHLYEVFKNLKALRPSVSVTGQCFAPESVRKDLIMNVVGPNKLNCSVCTYSPCLNGATCVVVTEDSYNCSCPFGFRGKHCEEKIMCAINLCHNNGTCNVVNSTTYNCSCPLGYNGKNCENEVMCAINPCLNNSTCVVLNPKEYKCRCVGDFEGNHCEVKVEKKKESGLKAGMIAAIVLIVLALLAVIIVVVAYRHKHATGTAAEKKPLASAVRT